MSKCTKSQGSFSLISLDFNLIFLSVEATVCSVRTLEKRRCGEQVVDAYKPTVKIGFPPLQVMNNSTWEATTRLEREQKERMCLSSARRKEDEAGGAWRRW